MDRATVFKTGRTQGDDLRKHGSEWDAFPAHSPRAAQTVGGEIETPWVDQHTSRSLTLRVTVRGTNEERPLTSVRAGQRPFSMVWRVLGSNQRRRTPADLQSAPFGHSGNPPCQPLDLSILPADARIARTRGRARIGSHRAPVRPRNRTRTGREPDENEPRNQTSSAR